MHISFKTHIFITGVLLFISALCLLAVFETTNKLKTCNQDKEVLQHNIESISNDRDNLIKKIDSCETYSFVIEKKDKSIVKPINPLPQRIVELASITSF